jgi:signal transduction histidine kinase
LSRLRSALEHSDERFVRVLEGIDDAVYVVDDAGPCSTRNPRLVRLSGEAPRHPTPRASPSASWPTASARWRWPVGRVAGRRDAGRPPRQPRFAVQARDITWVDGRDAHLVVMRDVTDQTMAQEMQRDHQEALHRTARIVALTETASTLAHELNQPLIAIVGYTSATARLIEQPDGDPRRSARPSTSATRRPCGPARS